ncbi:WbqC family protein [uncultured Duncaniella sp.]|uniref:WbqC family protein n=1 Tax=uncultured Duncaniella sp. TaxID=2768039 RepID=UPI0025DD3CCE|nr:WbqC family protein [uncultured Duncaniella sp.]
MNFEKDITVIPPLFCGSIGHYLHVRSSDATVIDWGRRFDKRFKDTHRFAIADTRGRLELTVPVAKPESSRCSWGDVRISDHGKWWDVHRVALESAYGRTPFFEFYFDKLLPMLTPGVEERFPLLRDLSDAWDGWIRSLLLLPAPLQQDELADGCIQERSQPHSASCIDEAGQLPVDLPPYWQVRADKLGFISGLSVLDLIFNLGPEAVLYLDRLSR